MTKAARSRIALIRQFSKGYVSFFILAVLMSISTTIWNALTPQIFRFTVDNVLDGKALDGPEFLIHFINSLGGIDHLKNQLWLIAAGIIVVTILSNISSYIGSVSTAKAGEGFTKNIRDTLFSHIQHLPMSWHSRHQTGDMIQRCTSDVNVIRNFVITQLLEVFRVIFLMCTYFGLMFSMNVKLAFIALAFVPVIILYSGVFFDIIARGFTAADEAEGELSTVVQENATGVRVVRAFGREQFEVDRFAEKNDLFTRLWIHLGSISGLYWGVGGFITGLQVVSVITVGAISAVHGELTIGEFIAFASYNTALQWPIRSLGRILSDMSKAGVSFDRVNYILSAKAEPVSDRQESEGPEIWREDITFSHVSYGYEDDHKVLDDVSFTLKGGTKFGILGGTGSGKSTLIQLLNRLYELSPEHGSISIGGRDIRELPQEWIRRNVGMVLQEPYLFSRSIRENIAVAVPDASLEEIREAARLACVDETIMNFPDGYDTIIGERGVTLSGGQRQRIAIARMLLMKTPIMIFDDSLSAVDAATDAMIRQALLENRTGATLILISHRITTLMGADQILVLHKGQVEELGTHEELIHQNGIYKDVYDIQMNQDDRKLLEGGAQND